ncbi:TMEM43 family protein [Legionella cardiaca]|uniref:TMEM43 family protein n=1 Tax=Legionella cardiaca TaxID=1071983 RepID=A0ABY8AQ20_9GAMM|nr:TMEM43 family protein [Legionella cardiaca]WED42735.1 TMEM43 family protein [Legionella cardiaca]
MAEEIVTKSWGSRIKDAFLGIFLGIGLIIAAVILIFWNERHGLHTAQSLVEAQKVLIPVSNSPIDPKNNLRVIYLSGLATTKDVLKDPILGLAKNAIGLNRTVEMYQWKQNKETRTESQMGGSQKEVTTYTYTKTWSTSLLDSSQYKEQAGHQNPAMMPLESLHQYANTVTVGDFVLPPNLIAQISETQPVDLDKVNTTALQNKINMPVRYINNQLYAGQNYQSPQIGDLRIRVTVTPPQTVSIIGQQSGNTLQEYMAKAGQPVLLLASGQESSDQLIQDALTENRVFTWVWRAGTLLMMIGGFSLILKPIVILADILPILGSIAGFSMGFVAFICGFALWALITAIAWFATRPLWSIGILLLAGVIIYFLYKQRKNKQEIAVKPEMNKN